MTIIYTILSVLVVSAISFIGVFTLAIDDAKLKKMTIFLVSLSAGTLLGDSFLHLMPEAIGESKEGLSVWLFLLAGMIVFFILEKLVCWRHCHVQTSENHPHPVGIMNLVGDGFHNFLDGIVIAGSFLTSPALGVATSIAVFAHEIPQEIGDFGVLLHAGYTKQRALFLNFIIALTAVAGALGALLVGSLSENFSRFVIPFTAGGFIYIATADLIPELKKDNSFAYSISQLIFILLGIGVMLGLKIFME